MKEQGVFVVFIYSHYVNNTVTMLIMTTVGLREQHVKHYCVIHFCISIILYLSTTLWNCIAPFENILVESNVLILRRWAAGAACETLLCYPFLYFNDLVFVHHTVGLR